MVDGAKFNSHDSGSHFKVATLKITTERKLHNVFTELEVARKIEHAIIT